MSDFWIDSYYSITMNPSGFIFYDPEGSLSKTIIVVESDTSVSASKIAYASSVIGSAIYDESSVIYDDDLTYDAPGAGVDVTVSIGKLIDATASVSFTGSSSVSGTRVATIDASIQIPGYVASLAKEILFPDISISIESNFAAAVSKVAYASCSLSGSCSVNIFATKETFASAITSIDSELIITASKLLYATVSIDSIAFSVIVGKEILFARASMSVVGSMLATTPIRFNSSLTEDAGLIRNLIIIDGKPLTEHNRKLDISLSDNFVENTNWENTRNRYYRRTNMKRSYSLSWSYVPNQREQTVDLKFGRDMINKIGNDPDLHVLKYINMDTEGLTPYSEDEVEVIVKSYSEKLIRRDLGNDTYFWDCQLELEEV
jgi:hypothetical protein